MNTTLIDSEAIALLSRITGQKISQRDLTPPVIFLAALVTVLLGVMFIDGTVTTEEKQRWQQTLKRFIPPGGNVRQLAQLMSKGIRQHQIYRKTREFLTLTAPLSESERLLLIGFGYEMSAADGEMDAREKQYLETIGQKLGLNPQYLTVLEAGFTHQETGKLEALGEVKFLLAPARFQYLDTIFVKAASDMLASLSTQPKPNKTRQHLATSPLSYEQLQEFQKACKQLDNFCLQVFQIVRDCHNRDFLPQTLAEDVDKVSKKLQSQRFRVAVIGEFSQGKSTLLNALLGEELQPVRAIPCSGTITVLRSGTQRRVICCYKNGQQEEVPFDQYHDKATLSEEAALRNLSEELVKSEIEEIIVEHPDFELCSSGVEIVDSPGLNEHPDRTAITYKLLKDTDAVIFLLNASRPLTQGERELLNDLRKQLSNGTDKPADNLFVAVNFMDLLRQEKDCQQVRKLVETFLQGQQPILTGNNRIHFISARAALDALLTGTEDEYLNSFQNFTQSIDTFLTVERGTVKIKHAATQLNSLIQLSLNGLHQVEKVLEDKLNLSEVEQQKILEQIGEASGHDVRILNLAEQLLRASIEQMADSWDMWVEGLSDRLAQKGLEWKSEYSPLWDKEKLFQDYANQFNHSLTIELDNWYKAQVIDMIVVNNLYDLDQQISNELEAIRNRFQLFDDQIGTYLNEQLNVISFKNGEHGLDGNSMLTTNEGEGEGDLSLMGGLGSGGLTVAALGLLTGIGFVPILLAGGAAAAIGSLLFSGPSEEELHFKVKQNVYNLGIDKFAASAQEIFDKVIENIEDIFYSRVNKADEVIQQVIACYESLLEQHEKAQKGTLKQREAEQAWIAQKRQELEQVRSNIAGYFD